LPHQERRCGLSQAAQPTLAQMRHPASFTLAFTTADVEAAAAISASVDVAATAPCGELVAVAVAEV